MLAKKWKLSLGRETCFHSNIFCRCSIEYLQKMKKYDRPFAYDFKVSRNKGQIVQVSPNQEYLLVYVGLKISSVLCGDIAIAPSLPREFRHFAITKNSIIPIGAIFYVGGRSSGPTL